jgi:hypothetical protein
MFSILFLNFLNLVRENREKNENLAATAAENMQR